MTHEPDIAAYANRTVTMRDGRILSDERTKSYHPRVAAGGDGYVDLSPAFTGGNSERSLAFLGLRPDDPGRGGAGARRATRCARR